MRTIIAALAATVAAALAATVCAFGLLLWASRNPAHDITTLPVAFALGFAYSALLGWPAAWIASYKRRIGRRHFTALGFAAGALPSVAIALPLARSESGNWTDVVFAGVAGGATGALSGLAFGAVLLLMRPNNSSKPTPLRGAA